MDKTDTGKSLITVLLKTWPALPYLGLGLWLSWPLMAFSGGIWHSAIEAYDEGISQLNLTWSVVFGLTSILAALLSSRSIYLIESRKVLLLAGLAGALGSLCIILAGSYYLRPFMGMNTVFLFLSGGILSGISSAFMLLKCGQLYSKLTPKKVLIYTALSHVLLAGIFFVVIGIPSWSPIPGGPSASGIVAFVLAIPASAYILTLADYDERTMNGDIERSSHSQRGFARVHKGDKTFSSIPVRADQKKPVKFSFRELPASFWKFLVMLFFFSAVVSMIRTFVVHEHPLDVTMENSSMVMVFRLLFSGFLVAAALNFSIKSMGFGKLYSSIALVLIIAIAMLPMINVLDSSLNLIISCAVMIFEYVLFCLLVFICYQKLLSCIVMIGFGYGVYMLGTAIGFSAGLTNIQNKFSEEYLPIFYFLIAGFLLVLTFILFSERDFDRLFSAINAFDTTLQTLPGADHEKHLLNDKDEKPVQGRFIAALDNLAAERGLSRRETDVFRFLAMGRGSDYIAEHLSISGNTVRSHTRNVYIKLDVHSRNELMNLVDTLKL